MSPPDLSPSATGRGTQPARADPAGQRGHFDLRLTGFAAGVWLAAVVVLHAASAIGGSISAGLGGWVCGGLAGLATAGVAAGWAASRGRAPRWPVTGGRIAVGALLGVLGGTAATATQVATRDASIAAALARSAATASVELVLRDDPRPVRGSPAGRPTYVVGAALDRVLEPPAGSGSGTVLILGDDPGWRALLPGQRVAVTGAFTPPQGADLTAAVLVTHQPPRVLGRPPWAQRAAGVLRAGLQRACAPLPTAPGGLLPGLVVGDTSRLDPQLAEQFRATGLTHLVAVSGTNVMVIMGAVLLLARWCRAGPRIAAAVSAVALVGFVILARPSPSVLRAAAMGATALFGLAAGRPRSATPALCAAVACLLLLAPELATDAGFTLSVLATGALLLLAPGWRDALRRRRVPAGVAEAIAVPAAAQTACAPVIAAISGTVSLTAVPANLLVVPAIPPATVLGVAAAVLSPVWPDGARFAAWLASWPARWLVLVARHGAELPGGTLPWPAGTGGGLLLAALTVALVLLARRRTPRRVIAVVTTAAVLGALPVRLLGGGWPPAGWVLVVCSVGQGDALVLWAGAGRAVVVDAGPEPVATDACLRRLGVRRVVLLLLTHFHADHVDGIAGVFRGRPVGAVLTSGWGEPEEGRRLVERTAAAHRVPVLVMPDTWSYAVAGVTLTALVPTDPLRGTHSDPNNNSLVLRADLPGLRLLLAGDAEEDEQRAILDRVGTEALHADLLKVAHHGSGFQDPDFLVAVRPVAAFVSVGAGNPYGHPSPSLLQRLRAGGTRVLRTDTDGDLAAVRTPDGLAVQARGIGVGRHPP